MDTTKYTLIIENGSKVSHVALFLLPNVPFDPAFAALIYFQLPGQDFKLFGTISASKPSAIFKLNNNNAPQNRLIDDLDMDIDGIGATPLDPMDNIIVGISIEPALEAERLLVESKQLQSSAKPLAIANGETHVSPSDPAQTAALATKIIKHAYNYLGSFVDSQGKVGMKVFDSWWDKFKVRLQNDPKFLDKQED